MEVTFVKHLVAAALFIAIVSQAAAQTVNKPELNFQQSPAKPTPEWVKLVDHGQYDALKGYLAPDGMKIK